VQDGYSISPLGPAPAHVADETVDLETEPLRQVNGMDALDYLAYAADLLAVNPPHASDFSQLARLAGLAVEAGKPFDRNRFSADEVAEIAAGKQDALQAMAAATPRLGNAVGGWMSPIEGMGVYGTAYLSRAVVTMTGLGANPAEDAVYPLVVSDADGKPVTGEHAYVIHFDADQLPPVYAFWSITMYDAEGFQVANELNRFAIGDRDPLTYNADGSLDLYL
jgi:hypothetical protein